RLGLEGSGALLGGEREPGIVRRRGRVHVAGELHIAAERQPADLPAGAAPIGPADHLAAEADREGLGLHPEPAADEIVAIFVDEDQRPDDQQEGEDGEKEAGRVQDRYFRAASAASSLALRSTSSTSSIAVGAGRSHAASTAPTTEAISRKPIRLSRKDATATSFAALRMAGRAPPATSASRARPSAGKRVASGASKSSRPSSTRSSRAHGVSMRSGQASV